MVTDGYHVPGTELTKPGGHRAVRIDLDQEPEAGVTLHIEAVEVSDRGVGPEYLRVLDHCPDVDMMTHGDTELTRGEGRGEDQQLGVVRHEAGLLHRPLSVGGGQILVSMNVIIHSRLINTTYLPLSTP